MAKNHSGRRIVFNSVFKGVREEDAFIKKPNDIYLPLYLPTCLDMKHIEIR